MYQSKQSAKIANDEVSVLKQETVDNTAEEKALLDIVFAAVILLADDI